MSFNEDDGVPLAKAPKGRIGRRQAARRLATQALYQWQMAGQSALQIEAQFRVDNDFQRIDGDYFQELLRGVVEQQADIDALFVPLLDRPLAEMDVVELSILRLSVYELLHRLDVPYRVVINEGIELAKLFGATDGYKFINSVLDRLAPQLRKAELAAGKR